MRMAYTVIAGVDTRSGNQELDFWGLNQRYFSISYLTVTGLRLDARKDTAMEDNVR